METKFAYHHDTNGSNKQKTFYPWVIPKQRKYMDINMKTVTLPLLTEYGHTQRLHRLEHLLLRAVLRKHAIILIPRATLQNWKEMIPIIWWNSFFPNSFIVLKRIRWKENIKEKLNNEKNSKQTCWSLCTKSSSSLGTSVTSTSSPERRSTSKIGRMRHNTRMLPWISSRRLWIFLRSLRSWLCVQKWGVKKNYKEGEEIVQGDTKEHF